jgi:high-affinity iron transporter
LKISGAILLLFAAGLASHGVHEFQEAGVLPVFHFDPLIDISQILDNTSVFGSILRTLFGYTATPTFLEIIMYVVYILFIFLLEVWTDIIILSQTEKK